MKSMTGYGAAEGPVGRGALFVELRSVNHRYCDLQLKIPPKLGSLDPRLRATIQAAVARGKIDCFIKERRPIAPAPAVRPNLELADAYDRALRALAGRLRGTAPHLLQAVDLRELVVVEEPTVRYERFWRQVHTIVRRALQQLERMRRTEGAHLQRDQRRRLSRLESLVGRIARLAGAIQLADRRERAAWGNGGAGGSTEGTSYGMPAERAAIHEEITRLQSHLRQYRQYAARPGPVGRQLDFLLQEMNREINTIGSKGNDANISHLVVEAKSELEKLREQVQNIE